MRQRRRMDAPQPSPLVATGSIREELAALWRLALPLALAQAGQALMGMVDTGVLGRLSASAQGAAGLGNSLTFTVTFFGMGVMMGLDPLISQAVGAGNHGRARSLLWQGFWLALATSAVVIAVLALVPLWLEELGVDIDVAVGAKSYMWWRLAGVPATLLFIGTRSYLQGVGRPQALFWAMVVANVANFGLDVLLVFGAGPVPPLGVAGAAIATTLCAWLQFGLLAFFLGPPPVIVQRAPDLVQVLKAARVGLPVGLHLIVESGVFSLAGVLAGRLGEASMAAHQIALTWASFTFCVAVGIGAAGTVRVGWGIGAGDTKAARRSGLAALGSGAAWMVGAATLFVVMPGPLARVMSSKPEVISIASALFAVTAVFQISDGVQAVGAGALRGAGDTRFPFWANLVGHWLIGLPIAIVLGVWGTLGVVGVWWGLSAGLTAVAIAVFVRFLVVTRRHVRAL